MLKKLRQAIFYVILCKIGLEHFLKIFLSLSVSIFILVV